MVCAGGHLPHRRPVPRAVRRSGAAAGGRRAQRHRAGDDPPDRPRPGRQHRAHAYATQQLDLDGAVGRRLRRRRSSWSATTAGCRPSPTRWGSPASYCCCCRCCPCSDVNINGARIWIRVGGFSFQPGEIAKICLAIFFAGYLVVKRDALALAGRRFMGIDLPRGRDLGPILLMWLVSLGVLVFQRDLGSSLLFFGLFVVLLYVATERAELADRRWRCCSSPAPTSATWPSATSRPGSTAGSTRSATATSTTRSSRASTAWPGAASSAAAGARAARTSRRTRGPTSSAPRSARSSGSPG